MKAQNQSNRFWFESQLFEICEILLLGSNVNHQTNKKNSTISRTDCGGVSEAISTSLCQTNGSDISAGQS